MADPWTRTEIPGVGRSICDRPGARDRLVIVVSREGRHYDCTVASGTHRYHRAVLASVLIRSGRTVPTDDDLAWLRGGP